jgi:hypothetical protein
MRVAVQVLLYNVDRFILAMLENCGPHVDRIYATWSPVPWTAYNAAARLEFKNKTTPDVLRRSRFHDKVVLIEGEWPDEASQRNAALDRARADDMDFLIVQDADEFYRPEDYQANIRYLAQHPTADYFRGRWHLFWKTTDWVLEFMPDNSVLANNENFAVNCRRPVRFNGLRGVNADWRNAPVAPGVCYHLSWLCSDEEAWEKVSTWGHADQVMTGRWFETKWRGWRPASRCLSPSRPTAIYKRAVRFDGELPRELSKLNPPATQPATLSPLQRLHELAWDCEEVGFYYTKIGWRNLRRAAGRT